MSCFGRVWNLFITEKLVQYNTIILQPRTNPLHKQIRTTVHSYKYVGSTHILLLVCVKSTHLRKCLCIYLCKWYVVLDFYDIINNMAKVDMWV